jgi:integrase
MTTQTSADLPTTTRGRAEGPISVQARTNRRPRGTGRIFQKHGNWYGQWHGLTRKLGPAREPGSRDGLTRTMAETRLRERMSETLKAPPRVTERITVGDAGRVRIKDLARKGRKVDTTLANYESEIRVHFEPHFGQTPIAQLDPDDVEAFLDQCFNAGLAAKSVRNLYTHLSGIFEFARRKRWTHANPCREVEKPASDDANEEIRFLDQAELDALLADKGPCRHSTATLERGARARALRNQEMTWTQVGGELGVSAATAMYLSRATPAAVLDDDLARLERLLYLVAAMTGLRQGELLGLRWRDIDWRAEKIRVVYPHVRRKNSPKYDEMFPAKERRKRSPKSAHSSRAVPMADRVGRELGRHYKASAFQADDDLVFGHRITGAPLNRHEVSRRFKGALKRARVREVRFHDLRHTFGTRMAAAGVPMRTLQEWMGHADIKTTLIYAHYAPSPNEAAMVNAAFATADDKTDDKLSKTGPNPKQENPANPDVEN